MALQLFGYIMSVTGLCGLILGTLTNKWKIIGQDNDESMFVQKYEGLWMECEISSSSVMHCKFFNSLLHQAFEIQLARVIMIISIVISSLGVLVAIFGLRCTRCLDENKQSKDRAAFAGGILSVCAGLFALGITSWFMYGIVDDFFGRQEYKKERYVIGNSLIGAFVASFPCLFGGVLLCACSVTHLQSNKHLSKHPVSKTSGKEYV
ncbi:claudin-1 [Siphateles boraxobius]|uniref:claudin-1 n=1 Tax=Siphateles boraxobius TaxID=180520 RepID=UPI004063634C